MNYEPNQPNSKTTTSTTTQIPSLYPLTYNDSSFQLLELDMLRITHIFAIPIAIFLVIKTEEM